MPIPESIQKIIERNKRASRDIKFLSRFTPAHPERFKGLPVYTPDEIDILKELLMGPTLEAYEDNFSVIINSCTDLYWWLDSKDDLSPQSLISDVLQESLEDMPLYITDRTDALVKAFVQWRLKIRK